MPRHRVCSFCRFQFVTFHEDGCLCLLPMEEDAALSARPEVESSAGGASHHVRNRRISVVAASYTHSDPEVAATQRAQLSAIQSRSSSFRGFSEDHLDMLFPLLTIIEVRVALVHTPAPSRLAEAEPTSCTLRGCAVL